MGYLEDIGQGKPEPKVKKKASAKKPTAKKPAAKKKAT